MKFLVTRPFPDAKVLVLLASLCFLLSCGKTEAGSGKSEVGSNQSQAESGKSDAPIGDKDAGVTQNNGNDKVPESGSPAPSASPQSTKGPTYASRGVTDDEVVAMQKPTSAATPAATPNEVDSQDLYLRSAAITFNVTHSFDPAALIARASELIDSTTTANRAVGDSSLDKSRYEQAAKLAEQGIAMLKAQPEPSESTLKANYKATLLEGLSVRAEALGALATKGDRSQSGAAETAYREYLAAESNGVKKTRAEYRFASMLVALNELDKARTTYEGLLARDVDDKQALAGLVLVHRRIAVDQKAAGKEAAATVNTELSASYADRLNKLASEPGVTTADVESGEMKTRELNRRLDRDYKAADRYEPSKADGPMPVREKARSAPSRVEEVEKKAKRRPGE